jgi:hypothetical protein
VPADIVDYLTDALCLGADDLTNMNRTKQQEAIGYMTLSKVDAANMRALMQNWVGKMANGAGQGGAPFTEALCVFADPAYFSPDDSYGMAGSRADADALIRARRAHGFRGLARQTIQNRRRRRLFPRWQGNTEAEKRGVGQVAAYRDKNDRALSVLQSALLDQLYDRYGRLKMLFTTVNLVHGTTFLRVLATSHLLYSKGFIMNPAILAKNAPEKSPINWDIRLNHAFLHAGINEGSAFVFATPEPNYASFLDPATEDPFKRKVMMDTPIGQKAEGRFAGLSRFLPPYGNYPVKPGGSEVLTLLEWGYKLDVEQSKAAQVCGMGFVLVPTGAPLGSRTFEDVHSDFNERNYETLMWFMRQLRDANLMKG